MLDNSSIMVTGATGSFGQKFVATVLSQYQPRRLVVFSRDELKQFEMQQRFPQSKHPELRFFLGDVRDPDRLKRAMEGVDTVVHAAALKQVPAAEYNPFECIKTNVLGAQNVIDAALAQGVQRIVALSTDKAAAPVNLYGATKLCSDKLFIAANNIKGSHDIRFSVVRYGNVMGSRGSVIPFFLEKRRSGVLPITDEAMTRFNIVLDEGVKMVFHALEHSLGGEVFVPKIPSYRITELAAAVAPNARLEIVGIRPGEKVHEEMITSSDSQHTIETNSHYIVVPLSADCSRETSIKKFSQYHDGKRVEAGFSYSSGSNSDWLDAERIRELIREHMDPDFQPAK